MVYSKKFLNLILLIILAHSLIFLMTFCSKEKTTPPQADKTPIADTLHGNIRVDNYFWLRDKLNPEVIKYLEAENEYTEKMMIHTKVFQEKLYNELLGRIKETDLSVSEKMDDYYYYSRTEEGKSYNINCRKKGSLDAAEEIILDENLLAAGYDYFRVGAFEVSPDHQLLAYSVDTSGSETFTIQIKNLRTNELYPEIISGASYGLEWANDNKTIFYTIQDEAQRPYKLFRHPLGIDPSRDELIYHETDDAFYLDLSKTRSQAYLLINLGSMTTTEIHYLDANRPFDKFNLIHPREHKMEYYVSHRSDRFYIRTNDGAENFKLITVQVSDPLKKNWKELIPYSQKVTIDEVDLFSDYMVVYEREKGLKKIRIRNFRDNTEYYVDFPEQVYTYWQDDNPEFKTDLLRFTYTSLTTPNSVYDFNMSDKTRELKKQDEVLGGYTASNYESERVFANAGDGTLIPISLVYRKGMWKDGQNPLFLYGYGAYGNSREPYFSSTRLSLLDRGFIYAIAHVRGGAEMGRQWYEKGKVLFKKNTFTDFIACAEHLINENYTSPEKLVAEGASAGGLLMGAVSNMRPDLFKIIIAKVPWVDVLNSMLDPSLPLIVIEYEEWGNPNIKEEYDYIKSYSPYDNVESKEYPNMLITGGLNDPRVMYWESAKWTAKLRALKTDDNLLLLKMNMGSGHFGSSGRYDYLKETAFEYAFIFDLLGINS